ncbi:unnamed protein product [Psylliodes chrysocephalus]|uniref:Alcohol dehydrogenase n=1 Tax=Psylliodes chrysocephalus TaxID=3402493 RepID=A0A9P0CYU8_9CUCU|nr:unnamed protein product [Psylliodes chrysocephala]
MVFNLDGKVAVVTGGASGIGLHYAKELLRNGVQGVTLADVNPTNGDIAIKEIDNEFGINRAIFVKTDVRDRQQLENAFQKTVEKFRFFDILVNNAGILNDAIWEEQIDINVNGTIHGILLAIDDFFPKYKQSHEGVIVSIASTAAVDCYVHIPIYSATKAAIVALTRAWGTPEIYETKKTRFFSVAPGVTFTPLIFDMYGRNLGPVYEEYLRNHLDKGLWPSQEPDHVAKELMKLIKFAHNGSMWIVEGGDPAYEYIQADRYVQKKNVLKTE